MAGTNILGEENVFLPPLFRCQKPNTLSAYAFYQVVQMSSMTDAHCPCYPVTNNLEGSNVPFILEACTREEMIFPC